MVVAGPRDLAPLVLDAAICASVRMVPSSWLEVTMRGCGFRVGFAVKLLVFYMNIFVVWRGNDFLGVDRCRRIFRDSVVFAASSCLVNEAAFGVPTAFERTRSRGGRCASSSLGMQA
jgi:hypothetical protein